MASHYRRDGKKHQKISWSSARRTESPKPSTHFRESTRAPIGSTTPRPARVLHLAVEPIPRVAKVPPYDIADAMRSQARLVDGAVEVSHGRAPVEVVEVLARAVLPVVHRDANDRGSWTSGQVSRVARDQKAQGQARSDGTSRRRAYRLVRGQRGGRRGTSTPRARRTLSGCFARPSQFLYWQHRTEHIPLSKDGRSGRSGVGRRMAFSRARSEFISPEFGESVSAQEDATSVAASPVRSEVDPEHGCSR